MQHTTNYNLSQYDATDRVTRDAFNADNLAIDAALKRVSDAAGAAQSTANSASSAAAAAQSAANAAAAAAAAGAKIVTGTYTGTGTYGQSSPNSLTFSGTPQLVFVAAQGILYNESGSSIGSESSTMWVLRGNTMTHTRDASGNQGVNVITWGDRSISWYSSNTTNTATYQLNKENVPYYWLAIL